MSENNSSKQQFLLGLFGGIAVVAVIGVIVLAVVLVSGQDQKGNVAGQTEANQNTNQTATPAAEQPANVAGVTTFSEKADAQICQEDGKPVVYLFSTTWCPHCKWIKEAFDTAMKKYVADGKIAAYHWEIDTNDNTLTDAKESAVPTEAMKVYQEFNPQGSIPTFVFGCKYYRIGNGHEQAGDLKAEVAEFDALIKELTK